MSLEDKIDTLTAAIQELTTVFRTAGNPFPVNAAPAGAPAPEGGEPPKRGPGRPKKPETPTGEKIPETGDPVGTTYWQNHEHNTVFSRAPGETTSTLAGMSITPAQFVERTNALKQAASVAAATAPAADPFAMDAAKPADADPFAMGETAPAPPKTLEEVTAKLKEVSNSKSAGHGREGVMAVLAKFQTTNIGGLTGKPMNEVFAAAEKLLTTGAL